MPRTDEQSEQNDTTGRLYASTGLPADDVEHARDRVMQAKNQVVASLCGWIPPVFAISDEEPERFEMT